MRFPILKAFLLLAFATSLLNAQQPDSAAQADSAAKKDDSQVTVYIYRYKQFVGSALAPSVYCDDTELARMENGRFFAAKLSSGKHTFHSNDKQAGIDVELKDGQAYYIRVEIAAGMMKGHGRLTLVAPEQGSYEIKKLKPLDSDRIKDSQHVVAASLEPKK
jgi:uncharacterized protein DUF2846